MCVQSIVANMDPGQYTDAPVSPTPDLSVNVSWPFFDFGRTKAQVAEIAAVALATRERLAEFDSVGTCAVPG